MQEAVADLIRQFPLIVLVTLVGWWVVRDMARQHARELARKDAEIGRLIAERDREINRLLDERRREVDRMSRERRVLLDSLLNRRSEPSRMPDENE